MVVPEYSATLEYPGELRVGLNGDHLTIAKYRSIRDPNFVKIANALRKIVANIQAGTVLHVPQTSISDTL
jgi:hypothetical protein